MLKESNDIQRVQRNGADKQFHVSDINPIKNAVDCTRKITKDREQKELKNGTRRARDIDDIFFCIKLPNILS